MSRKHEATPFGPQNPHPLSTMRTELVWEGKYDEYGNRREIDIAGLSMPMQRIETIDQPRSEAAAAGQLDLFNKKSKRLDDFRNRLIWGDNKLVMASLLRDFKGKVDLIYIDPPFDVGADFTMEVPIGDTASTIAKDQSTLEMVAYRDMWGRGTDSYLHMMFERLTLAALLLKPTGSLYVHCDHRVNYFLRSILDQLLSRNCFVSSKPRAARIAMCCRRRGLPSRGANRRLPPPVAGSISTSLRACLSDTPPRRLRSWRTPVVPPGRA